MEPWARHTHRLTREWEVWVDMADMDRACTAEWADTAAWGAWEGCTVVWEVWGACMVEWVE
jgi:hypothetical protein